MKLTKYRNYLIYNLTRVRKVDLDETLINIDNNGISVNILLRFMYYYTNSFDLVI